MSEYALTIRNLQVIVGTFRLNNISLQIPKGTIMGFIGKNGAGKTTLIKSLLDVIQPVGGEILFDGIPLYGNEESVKSKVAVVYDSLIYPLNMTPKKIVKMISPFYPRFESNIYNNLMARFRLYENQKLSQYSKGMKMKFSIAMALSQNPDLLILDEPTAGLDPEARADVLDILLEFMQDENKTVFFSTHITSDLDKIADYITLIDSGSLLFTAEKDALLDEYALVHIEKVAITRELWDNLHGAKETVFGYEGLCSNKALFANAPGVKMARPTVEDIMIFRGGIHENSL